MQFANEVSLLSPEMMISSLHFFNLSAGFLLQIPDEALPFMPEHLVVDICDYITFVTRFSAMQMKGVNLGDVFRIVVKLLSPTYASVSTE